MKYLNKVMRHGRIVLIGIIMSLCVVMGIVPVLPKRREQAEIEYSMEEPADEDDSTGVFPLKEHEV
jgi:hypothetical protein